MPSSFSLEGTQAKDSSTYNPTILHSCRQEGEPCDICRRWDEVEHEIKHSRTSPQRGLEARQSLKLEFNHQYDPVGGGLPVEVVCRIFGFCLPKPFSADFVANPYQINRIEAPTRPVQLDLGAVCHTWRTIAWSYQRLWADIIISLNRKTPSSRLVVLNEWIARSGQLPLAVFVDFKQPPREPLDWDAISFLMDPLVTILNGIMNRCILFFAKMPAYCIERLRMKPRDGSLLQGLALQRVEARTEFDNIGGPKFSKRARPRVLLLSGVVLEDVNLGWGDLEAFLGDSLTPAECLEVIRRSPQLMDCFLDNISDDAIPFSTEMVQSNLEILKIDRSPHVFRYLTLPCLQELHCNLNSMSFASTLAEFVIRSQCPVETANFIDAFSDDEDLIEFLSLLPSLETLELSDCVFGTQFFETFGSTFYSSTEDGAVDFLPNLVGICFSLSGPRTFVWSDIPLMAPKAPTNMVNIARRPLKDITFYLSEEKQTYIDKESLEKMVNDMAVPVYIQDDTHGIMDLIAESRAYYSKQERATQFLSNLGLEG